MFAAPAMLSLGEFHGSTGYGQDFTDSISAIGGPSYEDLMRAFDHLLATYPFIDNQRGGGGGLYGG
jgi:dipeptidyl aminopeptidase/acylaminoacyl peptidase